jgi:DNA-binding transcriptional regulator YhcF (GntR family)
VANQGERFASQRLAEQLKAEIIEGTKYRPGARLPSYRQLRAEHHVAINTAQAAVRRLAAEGFVEIRAASGVYVRDRTKHVPYMIEKLDIVAATQWTEVLEAILERVRDAQEGLESLEVVVSSLLTEVGAVVSHLDPDVSDTHHGVNKGPRAARD